MTTSSASRSLTLADAEQGAHAELLHLRFAQHLRSDAELGERLGLLAPAFPDR